MTKIAHDAGKSLIANVVGFSNEEFIELILLAQDSGADMVELNFSCPNVWEGGLQEQIISYHASLIKDVLMFIKKAAPTIPICVKISPLPPDTLKEVAKVIVDSKIVKAITATNSYPNASTSTGTTTENEVVLGGLTGRSLKPISLGVVKQLRSLLPEHIDIIGCGGISSLNDVEDYLNTGAKAIQIATGILDNGTEIFEKILFPLI
jgi:dihydroorotate dehydrogenase (fumarate)